MWRNQTWVHEKPGQDFSSIVSADDEALKTNKQNPKPAQVSWDFKKAPGKGTKKQSKDSCLARLKKAEKPINNSYETLACMDDLIDIPENLPQHNNSPKDNL